MQFEEFDNKVREAAENHHPAYDEKAKYLAGLFVKNFEKYASGVSAEVLAAAPKS